MLPGVSPGMRGAVLIVVTVPMSVIALAISLLWILGLLCGKDRRKYITGISQQAMTAIVGVLHGEQEASKPAIVRSRELPSGGGRRLIAQRD